MTHPLSKKREEKKSPKGTNYVLLLVVVVIWEKFVVFVLLSCYFSIMLVLMCLFILNALHELITFGCLAWALLNFLINLAKNMLIYVSFSLEGTIPTNKATLLSKRRYIYWLNQWTKFGPQSKPLREPNWRGCFPQLQETLLRPKKADVAESVAALKLSGGEWIRKSAPI